MVAVQEDTERLRGEVRTLMEQLESAKRQADEHRSSMQTAQVDCNAKVRISALSRR